MTDDARNGGGGPERRGLVSGRFWERHSSPRSVWALLATYPVLVLAVYRRSRVLLVGVLVSLVVNLLVVSPPETDDAWATRVVLGERAWLERGLLSSPSDLGLVAVGAAVNLYTLRAAVQRRSVEAGVGTGVSVALSLRFFDRMARLYDAYGDAETGRG